MQQGTGPDDGQRAPPKLETVGRALGTHAAEVREIKARLEALRVQAADFERSVEGDGDWADEDDKRERNNELVGAVNALTWPPA